MLGFSATTTLPIADDGIATSSASSSFGIRGTVTSAQRMTASQTGQTRSSASITATTRIRVL